QFGRVGARGMIRPLIKPAVKLLGVMAILYALWMFRDTELLQFDRVFSWLDSLQHSLPIVSTIGSNGTSLPIPSAAAIPGIALMVLLAGRLKSHRRVDIDTADRDALARILGTTDQPDYRLA